MERVQILSVSKKITPLFSRYEYKHEIGLPYEEELEVAQEGLTETVDGLGQFQLKNNQEGIVEIKANFDGETHKRSRTLPTKFEKGEPGCTFILSEQYPVISFINQKTRREITFSIKGPK